jgi:cell division protein FtsW
MIGKIIDNKKGDPIIWSIIVALSAISLVEVYSSSRQLAHRYMDGNTEYYLFKHSMILIFAMTIIYLVHRIDHHHFSRVAKFMMLASVLLMLYTLFFGQEINDAKRWINIPVINLSFQSSDFAKLGLIMYTSRTIAIKQGVIKSFKEGFIPVMLPIVIICGLIMFENMSTALILLLTNLIIMFLGRVSLKYIFATIGLGIAGIGLVILLSWAFLGGGRLKTWEARIDRYWNADPENPEYQVMHANIAIAKGGLIRFAPGKSTQSNFLPEAYADYIFATIIEEFGLMGGAVIVFLYLLLLYRIILIVRDSPRVFGALMALGLGMSIVIQAFINMAVTVGLLPVTGLTLPFVSMGGTSIWFNGFAVGIILSVSRNLEESQQNKSTYTRNAPQLELNV